jgi:hypothetical protein
VPAGRVVLDPDAVELGFEHHGIVDGFEVGSLALDVAEGALDPGLVGRGARAASVPSDGQEGHELPGIGGHRWAVVAQGEQDRAGRVVEDHLDLVAPSSTDKSVSIQRRLTISTMTNATRRAGVKWVAS